MADKIQFVRNYSDLSTNKGFQFEFYCDRCGSDSGPSSSHGYRNRNGSTGCSRQSVGGLFSRAADVSGEFAPYPGEKAHDEAFVAAAEELRPDFVQCPRCSSWVCRSGCWNNKKGLCKECAPDLGVEMAAAQASKSVEEVWAHAAMAEEDKKLATEYWRETIRASCPQCEAPLSSNAKFCPECGAPLKVRENCPACGTKLTPGSKFCAECGQKI